MRTTKPISTISFNTPEYLRCKLDELQDAGRISFWAFITHEPEDDEGGKKKHSHVYVEPAKMLQTDDLKEALKEFDPEKPDKPRGCLTWHSSKFDDWYLYALHDAAYLATKQQSRRYHYSAEKMVASDPDDLTCKARSIDMLAVSPYAAMMDAQKQGLSWADFFRRGIVPITQLRQWEQAWYLLQQGYTDRNGREGHANDADDQSDAGQRSALAASAAALVDRETGEYLGTEDDFCEIN